MNISYQNSDGHSRRLKVSVDGDWITLIEVQREPNRYGYKTPHREEKRLSLTRAELRKLANLLKETVR